MEYGDAIKPWGIFLWDIAREVRDEELRDIKLIIGDKLGAGERQKITDPVDLLELLEDKGLIGEDNTALLRELFVKAEYAELIPVLDKYEQRRREYVERVTMLAGRRDPLFVGRDWYIRTIVDFFREARHPGMRCICLWGMAGCGKTKLGAETCAIYTEIKGHPKPNVRLVDLTRKTSVDEVGMALLSSVGKPVEAAKFDWMMVFNWIMNCKEEYVLLFDNADDLLKPNSSAKNHFQNKLKETLEWPNPNIKIIITSRYEVNFGHLTKHDNFTEIEVQSLEMEEAVKLLTMSVQQSAQGPLQVAGRELITERQAIQLSEHCGNNPQALRAVASQLRMGKDPEMLLRLLANPTLMKLVLNEQSIWGLGQDATEESVKQSKQVLQCLGVMFEDMDPALKPLLIRLAVLPGLFTRSWGLNILVDLQANDSDYQILKDQLEFRLNNLAATSLLLRESLDIFQVEEQGQRAEEWYSMHPLVRCLCLMKVESDEQLKKAFQSGLVGFMKECFQLLKQFTSFDIKDASASLQRLEKEKINITQYMELEMRTTVDGGEHPLAKYLPDYKAILHHSNIAGNTNIMAFMERFLFTKERSRFFQKRAETAKKYGDVGGWVSHQGWYADQQLQLHMFNEAENAIVEPISYCEQQRLMNPSLNEGYSQCLYVKGNLLVLKPQPREHLQNDKRKEGSKVLSLCIRRRREHLGDSVVLARSINALGSSYFMCEKYEEALEQHTEAQRMLERVTEGRPETHPDYTFYLMNTATCYHELGYKFSCSITQKERGKRYYQSAIDTYEKGQEMLRGVGLDKTSIMGTMLKNLAMTYCEMKEYKKALDYADQAAGIRKKTLGDNHPDVARTYYFIGSLYVSLGNEKKERGSKIFDIDEYKEARNCFDKALEIEFKVGYGRRSQDYHDLKSDIATLLKKLSKKRELERYNAMFKRHEAGSLVPLSELQEAAASGSSRGTGRSGAADAVMGTRSTGQVSVTSTRSEGSTSGFGSAGLRGGGASLVGSSDATSTSRVSDVVSSSSCCGDSPPGGEGSGADSTLDPLGRKRSGDLSPTGEPASPPDPKKCYIS